MKSERKIISGQQSAELSSFIEDDHVEVEVEEVELETKRVISEGQNPKFLKFGPSRKKVIVAISSSACFLSPMATMAFAPAIPTIAEDFNTIGTVITVSNSVYNIFMSLSSIWGPFSDVYGRRPTFILCMVIMGISMVLTGLSQNLAMFFVFRATTALAGASFFTIGAQMIADIYPPINRGGAMGWNIAGAQIGPPLGPTLGGIIVTYSSWRVIFYTLAGISSLVLALAIFFLPETMEETKHSILLREYNAKPEVIQNPKMRKKFIFVRINIISSITSIRFPNLLLAGLISSSMMYNMYSLLTPIRYVVDPRFNLTKPLYSGLFYLAPGFGYFSGSFLGGRLSDWAVRRGIKVHGVRIPEDRLYVSFIPLGFIMPVSVLIYGWSLEYEKGGYALPIISLFFNGFGQSCVFPSVNTYTVDSMASKIGGAAVGSNYFVRFLASALASGVCLKQIQDIGIGWTSTISAFVLWIGFILVLVLHKYGEQIRRWQNNKFNLN